MGTQGLVTIQDTSGKVLMKIVTGTDGDKAESLADAIEIAWPMDAQDAFDTAYNIGFGDYDSLVVITDQGWTSNCAEAPGPLYQSTFDQPRFNPRWEHGTADFISVVTVKAAKPKKPSHKKRRG